MTELRRYTSIPSLIDIIHNKGLTLLSPDTWDDKNDVYVMRQYKKYSPKNIKALLALCFTEAEETFHHWNVFAGNSSGACIVFDKNALIECIDARENCRHGSVKYLEGNDPQFSKIEIDELPFIKRNGYNDEREYRIIYEDSLDHDCYAGIPIDMSCIKKIVFPRKTPSAILVSLSEVIKKMDSVQGCNIPIERSELTDDFGWQIVIDCITHPERNPAEVISMRMLGLI